MFTAVWAFDTGVPQYHYLSQSFELYLKSNGSAAIDSDGTRQMESWSFQEPSFLTVGDQHFWILRNEFDGLTYAVPCDRNGRRYRPNGGPIYRVTFPGEYP